MSVFREPRIVTRAELERAVLPHIIGYTWAVKAIDELWNLSTPVPVGNTVDPSRRILYPSMFAQWWADVQQRRGISTPLDKIIPAVR